MTTDRRQGVFERLGVFGVRLPTFVGRRRLRLVDGVTALVGPNGTGKSVCLAGLETAFSDQPTGDQRQETLGKYVPWLSQRLRGRQEALSTSDSDEEVEGPLLYLMHHNSEPLLSDTPEDDWPEVAHLRDFDYGLIKDDLRSIPFIDCWDELEGGPLSVEAFVDSPFRTYRKVGGIPRVGYAVPWHLPPLNDQVMLLSTIATKFELWVAELDGPWRTSNDSFFDYIDDPLSFLMPFDDSGDAVDLSASEEEVAEIVDQFLVAIVDEVQLARLGTRERSAGSEWAQVVMGEVPHWAPFVGFELSALDEDAADWRDIKDRVRGLWTVRADFEPDWVDICKTAQNGLAWKADWECRGDSGINTDDYATVWRRHAEQFQTAVQNIFRILVSSEETLLCETNFLNSHRDGWSLSRGPQDVSHENAVPIDLSSDTIQRWAALAVQLALNLEDLNYLHSPYTDDPPILLIDEPERGLGQAAQMHLARGLSELHEVYGINVIVATHSATMVSHPNTRLVGLPDLTEISEPSRTELETLGFTVAELLAFYKFAVLVEGHHEEIILNKLIGPELAEKRARILPYRGTSKLSSAALDDLFAFSGSKFIVTADNTRTELLNQALKLARNPSEDTEIKKELDELLGDLTQEEQAIRTLIFRAVETHRLDRIQTIVGLDAPDILDCLPVETFTEAGTWEELRAAHQHDRSAGVKDTPNDFKKWLEIKHNVDFSDENILAAVEQLDELPDFIAQLLDAVS